MTKLLIGPLIAALLGFASPSYANQDKVLQVDGFQGGFEIRTLWGNYCIMSSNDTAPTYIYTAALAAKFNGADIWLYNANQTGWGYGVYGGNTCTNLYAQ